MDASAWREKERERQREREKEREMGKESERILYGGENFTRATFKVVPKKRPIREKPRPKDKEKDNDKDNKDPVVDAANGSERAEATGEATTTSTFTPSLAKPSLKRVWSAGRARPRSPMRVHGEAAGAMATPHRHHAQHGGETLSSNATERPRFRRQCSADASLSRHEVGDSGGRPFRLEEGGKSGGHHVGGKESRAMVEKTGISKNVSTLVPVQAEPSDNASKRAPSKDAVQTPTAMGTTQLQSAHESSGRTKTKDTGGASGSVATGDKDQSSRAARRAAHEAGRKERKAKTRPIRIKYESTDVGPGGRREITHASLGKLVARLTDAHQYDVEFRDAFLLSYRCFCSPYEFIKKLIKRYTAVMALCGNVDAKGLPESLQSREDAAKEESRGVSTTSGSSLAKRTDAQTNAEASVSVMRVLSVLKYWIKESGFIEMDLFSDRRSQKKLLAFLSEIQVTTPIPSIRQHAQSLYMNVAQIVRNQPTLLTMASPNAALNDTLLVPPALTPSTSVSSSNDPLADDPSSPGKEGKLDAAGGTPSKLASAISMLKLTRSTSDPRKERTAAPKLQRGVTAGSDLPDHERNPLEDVIHDTVHRSRLVASRANSSKTSYDNARPFSGITAQELADQMTLVEAESYFSRINPRELVNKSWTRDTKHRDAPHVMGIIELFDGTAEWISSEILHPQLQAAERGKLISLFIDAAENCLELNNFNSLFEIITGLSAPCIRQLNTTWGLMNAASLEKYQSLMQTCSPEDNYRNYRQMFTALEGQPRLPCSFVLVKDLFALEESMKTIEDNLIHWTKFRKISKLIYEMLDRQNTNYLPTDGSTAVGISRKGRGALHHDRNMQVQIRHRLETIRKDSSVLFQLARNANTQESIMFVTSLSEAGFL